MMAKALLGLIAGILFGSGLVISGMTNPAKVQNFLDLAGTWDPSLAFVMAGAIGVASSGFWLVLRRPAPLLTTGFQLPNRTDLDARLLIGAGLFGMGWGLAGLCPGPAVSALSFGGQNIFIFMAAMLIGMIGAKSMRFFLNIGTRTQLVS